MKLYKWLTLVLACVLLLSGQIFASEAIVTTKDVSLTIDYHDGDKALPGAAFYIYYIATVDAYNYSEFTLTGDFADSAVVVNNMTSEAWQNAARTLAAYAQLNRIDPLDSGNTGNTGKLTFPTSADVTMKPGLYLVVGSRHVIDGKTYDPDPFLVSLPVLNEKDNAWDYNGTVVPKVEPITPPPTPPDVPTTIDRKVIKVWNDKGYEFARPSQIKVTLLRDGVPHDSVILHEANNWTYRWTGLDPNYTWTVVEDVVPDGYTVSIGKEGITFVITNTYHPDVPTTDKKVVKIWDDAGHTDKRPAGIVVELLRDGVVYDTVTLSEANNWSYHWTELDPSYTWTVNEKYVPDGYTASITTAGNTFVITNIYKERKKRGDHRHRGEGLGGQRIRGRSTRHHHRGAVQGWHPLRHRVPERRRRLAIPVGQAAAGELHSCRKNSAGALHRKCHRRRQHLRDHQHPRHSAGRHAGGTHGDQAVEER